MVAPIQCSLPLAKAGFKILAASRDPSLAPVPTNVCISSINKIIFLCSSISLITFFSLSSNSPLNLVPAIRSGKSKATNLYLPILSGTDCSIILVLIPSAKAVFPTPGSPIRIGLFLVLLDKTCIDLFISLSLPMIGSILLFFANSVKSIVYFFILSY